MSTNAQAKAYAEKIKELEAKVERLRAVLDEILEAEQKRAVIPMGWVSRAKAALRGEGEK